MEEEEIKRLREKMIPLAQGMPFFDRPFVPNKYVLLPLTQILIFVIIYMMIVKFSWLYIWWLYDQNKRKKFVVLKPKLWQVFEASDCAERARIADPSPYKKPRMMWAALVEVAARSVKILESPSYVFFKF